MQEVEIASPFTSMRAVLEIEDAKFDEGDFGPQIRADMSVVDDGQDGENNGITFSDWFGFGKQQSDKSRIMPRSKAHQLLTATLGEVGGRFNIQDLVGKRFAAQVGLNKAKSHSKVVHDTIGPAPAQRVKYGAESDDGADVDDLPGIEALDVPKS
jgi:hypothetical protein